MINPWNRFADQRAKRRALFASAISRLKQKARIEATIAEELRKDREAIDNVMRSAGYSPSIRCGETVYVNARGDWVNAQGQKLGTTVYIPPEVQNT